MLRIVSQAIPPSNGERYQRAVAAARAALEQAIAVSVPADTSFAERERAILAAANDACRLALETTPQAAAHPDQVRVDGVLYERHHEGTVVYHSLCGPLEVRGHVSRGGRAERADGRRAREPSSRWSVRSDCCRS
jgi:hypothetical protein